METRQQPVPRPPVAPQHAANPRQFAETARQGVVVRVSVLDEPRDDEEKEAGYGHGV